MRVRITHEGPPLKKNHLTRLRVDGELWVRNQPLTMAQLLVLERFIRFGHVNDTELLRLGFRYIPPGHKAA